MIKIDKEWVNVINFTVSSRKILYVATETSRRLWWRGLPYQGHYTACFMCHFGLLRTVLKQPCILFTHNIFMAGAVTVCPVTAEAFSGHTNQRNHCTSCIILNWQHICVSVEIDRTLGLEINICWSMSFTETALYAFLQQRANNKTAILVIFAPLTSCNRLLRPKVQAFN